jgi:hypothetical protein
LAERRDNVSVSTPSGPSSHRTQIIVAAIGVTGLVIVAMVTGLFGLLGDSNGSGSGQSPSTARGSVTVSGGNSTNKDTCVGGGAYVEGDVNCTQSSTTPAKPITPTTADAGCGTVEGTPPEERFRFKVIMWCAPEAVRGQYQYKLKVSITNTGTKRLDIHRERFVLLWRTFDTSHWTPPPRGAPRAPFKTKWQDRSYWAVSANLDEIAEALEDGSGPTFATHWAYTSLAPGHTSLVPKKGASELRYEKDGVLKTIRFNVRKDDLVFYVPVKTVDRDHNFLGLGYWDGSRIVAVCPQPQWGPKVPPSGF